MASSNSMNVSILNPSEQIRTVVEVLVRNLAHKKGMSVTLVLPERAEGRTDAAWDVRTTYYNDVLIPGIRYPVPGIGFLQTVASELERTDVFVAIDYDYLPSALAAVMGTRFEASIVLSNDALPGISWSYGNRGVDTLAKLYTHTIGRVAFAAADAVVGLGEYIRPELESLSCRTDVSIIPNGIDLDWFCPPDDGVSTRGDDTLQLLYVGRLDPVKGVSYLLKAHSELHSRGIDAHLTIVGSGTRRDAYEASVTELGIRDAVDFVGFQEDVRQYYRQADIFVLPSLSEGQPTVLMEAQASGLPVVSTDVGGARELVAAGRIVPTENATAIARAVEQLSTENLSARSRDAREHAIEKFSEDKMVKSYRSLFQKLEG